MSTGLLVVDSEAALYQPAVVAFSEIDTDLVVPSWDLEDRIAIGVTEIWQQQLAPLQALRERYSSDCALYGAIYQSANGAARANWYARCWDLSTSTLAVGDSVDEVLRSGRSLIMELQRERMGVALASESQRYRLTIQNVNSYEDYSSLFDYLASMFQVTDVVIRSIRGNQIEVEVSLLDDVSKWRMKLRQDEKLTIIDSLNFAWSESTSDAN